MMTKWYPQVSLEIHTQFKSFILSILYHLFYSIVFFPHYFYFYIDV